LEEFGIRDRNLWRLQQLVADEILQLMPPRCPNLDVIGLQLETRS
jgi:hypothetical protein